MFLMASDGLITCTKTKEKFHQSSEKSVTDKGMDFLQAKSPFLGLMCNPTVAIATNYNITSL